MTTERVRMLHLGGIGEFGITRWSRVGENLLLVMPACVTNAEQPGSRRSFPISLLAERRSKSRHLSPTARGKIARSRLRTSRAGSGLRQPPTLGFAKRRDDRGYTRSCTLIGKRRSRPDRFAARLRVAHRSSKLRPASSPAGVVMASGASRSTPPRAESGTDWRRSRRGAIAGSSCCSTTAPTSSIRGHGGKNRSYGL